MGKNEEVVTVKLSTIKFVRDPTSGELSMCKIKQLSGDRIWQGIPLVVSVGVTYYWPTTGIKAGVEAIKSLFIAQWSSEIKSLYNDIEQLGKI